MRKLLIAWVIGTICMGCAITSQNRVVKGDFRLSGGTAKQVVWSEAIIFERTSWYKQTSLVYEVLLAPLSKDSPFYVWFSDATKNALFSCASPYILLDYSLDSTLLPHSIIRKQLAQQGFSEIVIPQFSSEFKNHPQYKISNLTFYSLKGYCRKISDKKVIFSLPGFM